MSENEKLKEKLDLLSALKEDEDNNKETVKKEKVQKEKKIHKTGKKKEKKSEPPKEKKVRKHTPPGTSRILLTGISFIALVSSLSYLIYTIIKATEMVNQPYLIITSACLFVISLFMVLIGFATNKKFQKCLELFGIILITLYTGFQFLVTSNIIVLPTLKTMKDFSNTSINEVVKWAHENKITLEQTYEYSDFIESDHVISQSIPANTLIKDIKTLEVLVSNGPNYESIVSIPNMVGWNIDDVVSKIKELKLNNVNIEYNFNEAVERDIAYEQNKSGEIRRNEELIIKFSLGNEADLKPVNLEDLTGKEEFDAILWLKRNGIKYEIVYEFSKDIKSGYVISTTPTSGTLIEQKETTVQIVISKGPKITAPDLMKMSLDEITEWAIKNKLVLIYESEYNNEIKAGNIIRVSIKEGDTLEENDRIYVVTSKGSLKMVSIPDGDITALRNFATENKIVLAEETEFSETIEKGKIIRISKNPGDTINSGESITVVISLGSSTEIPNFIGMTASKAESTCKSIGLSCRMSYVYSSSKAKGKVFNQSMNAGSKVIEGTSIVLTVSNGPKPSSNSSNGGSGNSGTTNVPEPPTPTCTSYKLFLQAAVGSVDQTKSMIQKLNPNGKFNFVTYNPGYGTTGALREDMFATYQNTTHTSCETITIYIIDRNI